MVHKVKNYLKKSIGNEKLSLAELLIVLAEVENVLNDLPFCFVYDVDVREIASSLLFS